MLGCPSRKVLHLYLDGALSPREAQRVRRHLEGCRMCTRAYEEMLGLEEAVRRRRAGAAPTPDVAERVTAELRARGAFFHARVEAAQRRIWGEPVVTGRRLAVVGLAVVILVAVLTGADHFTRLQWTRRTVPVVEDAERVLVRLVASESLDGGERLAWAREEARKLALPNRLAAVQSGARPALAGDLAYLAQAFTRLAEDAPLAPAMVVQLGGEALGRAVRLRESLGRG